MHIQGKEGGKRGRGEGGEASKGTNDILVREHTFGKGTNQLVREHCFGKGTYEKW
jgi:hypothetical protein